MLVSDTIAGVEPVDVDVDVNDELALGSPLAAAINAEGEGEGVYCARSDSDNKWILAESNCTRSSVLVVGAERSELTIVRFINGD